jgi:signal transduction histidine kinase
LLSNAVKYNKVDGKIEIHGKSQHGIYILNIKDTGCGMTNEQLPFVFDRFKRFRPSDEISYGLGLPIVKSIAEFHGVTIKTQSIKNEGSIFSLHFPASTGS